jgi:Carboxypeptidase regulatory-like domain
MRALAFAAALVAVLLAPAAASAGTTGELIGTVTEAQSGAPIAGVSVTVDSPGQREKTISDANGHFVFVSLQPGTYTVEASHAGYGALTFPAVAISADASQKVSIALSPRPNHVAHMTDCFPGGRLLGCSLLLTWQTYYAVNPKTPFYSFDGTSIYALHFVPGLTFGAGPALSR